MPGLNIEKIPRDLAPLDQICERIEFALSLDPADMDGISAQNLACDGLELLRRLGGALKAIAGSDGSWNVARYARDVLDGDEQDDYSLDPYAVAIALETLADQLKALTS